MRRDGPGPASWELGSFPEGRDDFPVDGVSWYEAAAYAEFVGKSLPTVYHWYRAAGIGNFSEILLLANFGGKGPAPVGTSRALSPFGNYDMAGNVKEWCWNETGGRRYVLGGSSTDVNYMFRDPDAQNAFDRSPGFGFRCVRYTAPLRDPLTNPIAVLVARLQQGEARLRRRVPVLQELLFLRSNAPGREDRRAPRRSPPTGAGRRSAFAPRTATRECRRSSFCRRIRRRPIRPSSSSPATPLG